MLLHVVGRAGVGVQEGREALEDAGGQVPVLFLFLAFVVVFPVLNKFSCYLLGFELFPFLLLLIGLA